MWDGLKIVHEKPRWKRGIEEVTKYLQVKGKKDAAVPDETDRGTRGNQVRVGKRQEKGTRGKASSGCRMEWGICITPNLQENVFIISCYLINFNDIIKCLDIMQNSW